ncbi:MAG: tRNA uridine-5-carboxymethylaminomethyl(34) synthesis GTPase MnmE [Pseudomonadota bacterium]
MGAPSATIFALATPPGRGGVAVIRISGPDAFAAGEQLAGGLPPVRTVGLRRIRARGGAVLDEALVLPFEAAASFTGERVVELHTHGSLAVVDAILAELAGLGGLTAAEPGEFTRRAFENGRLDLVQVEGLAELIEAETEEQLRRAQDVYSGSLSRTFLEIREGLVEALALSEARIDFADEELPDDLSQRLLESVGAVASRVRDLIAGASAARRVQSGFEIAIVGPPNVGKSTLLNAIAEREAALVSDIAGTTRDVIEVRLSLGGLLVTFLDTAGLRETDDVIESAGVSRARARARQADLRLFLCNPGGLPDQDLIQTGDILRWTKADLHPSDNAVSAVTGEGMSELLSAITFRLRHIASSSGLMASRRQEDRAVACLQMLEAAISALGVDAPAEFVSEELRGATRELDAVLGKVDVEAVLGQIFSSFCIGK